MMPRDRRALLVLVALWAISTGMWLNPGITKPDGVGYYVYLPSLRIDGDLLFFNEWGRFGMIDRGLIQHKEVTSTDHLGNHWSIGSAIFWMPSFLLADVLRMLPQLNAFPPDGVSLPYNVAVGFASSVAGCLTLIIGFYLARSKVSMFPALLAALGIWFGTPLLFYSVRNPIMSHAPSALACALVVLLSTRLREQSAASGWFAVGLACGFAIAVRPQNAAFALVPFIIVPIVDRLRWQSISLFGGGLGLAVLPQALLLYFLYGNPLGMLSGDRATRPFASFERIWVWEPILSWYHGLIPWSPIIAVGIAGLCLLWKVDRRLALAGIYAFASQWFVNATLERSFWGAHAFGQRRFDNCTIFFLIGAAVVLAKWPRGVQIAVVSLASIWTMSIFFASMGPLDPGAYYTPGELFTLQLEALARAPALIAPLASVPAAMKGTVFLLCVALAAAWALAAAAAVATRRRGLAPAAAAVALYLLVMSGAVVVSGFAGRDKVAEFSELIAFNRKVGPAMGAADFRTALLIDEARYLRKAGRTSEAEATERELAEIQAERRKALDRLRVESVTGRNPAAPDSP